jgi:hypothetical protein
MKHIETRAITEVFRSQHGVAARSQLRLHGVTAEAEQARVARGEWDRPTTLVVRAVATRPTPGQALMIALLDAGPGAVASHGSAAWLWDLAPAPERPAVTTTTQRRHRAGPFVVHRLKEPAPVPFQHKGFPVTNPLRTLVDLAGVVSGDELDEAVDRALAARLLTVEGIEAEVERLSEHGRKGTGAMRRALARRGLAEGPNPSVLEARFHRLLRMAGITPQATEVVAGPDGRFRIDTVIRESLAVEVDGQVHHSTPEQKAYDERRRNEIRMGGVFLLVYTWRDVVMDGRRVAADIHRALARNGPAKVGGLAK